MALFEGLFETRIPGIIRTDAATTHGARVHNTQLVLDELGGTVLEMELGHLNAEALVQGNVTQILDLVDILGEIGRILDGDDDERDESGDTGEDGGHGMGGSHGFGEGMEKEGPEWAEDVDEDGIGAGVRAPGTSQHHWAEDDGSYSFQPADALRQSSPGPEDLSSISIDPESRSLSFEGHDEGTFDDIPSPSSSIPTTTTSRPRRHVGSSGSAMSEVKDDIGEFLANKARRKNKEASSPRNDVPGRHTTTVNLGTSDKRIRFDLQVHTWRMLLCTYTLEQT